MSAPTEQEVRYDFIVRGRWLEEIVKNAHDQAQQVLGDDYTLDTIDVRSDRNGLSADCTATALVQVSNP